MIMVVTVAGANVIGGQAAQDLKASKRELSGIQSGLGLTVVRGSTT